MQLRQSYCPFLKRLNQKCSRTDAKKYLIGHTTIAFTVSADTWIFLVCVIGLCSLISDIACGRPATLVPSRAFPLSRPPGHFVVLYLLFMVASDPYWASPVYQYDNLRLVLLSPTKIQRFFFTPCSRILFLQPRGKEVNSSLASVSETTHISKYSEQPYSAAIPNQTARINKSFLMVDSL